MPVLARGVPITTDDPVIDVTNALPPGRHRFALEVIDAQGRRSLRDEVFVTIVAPSAIVRDRGPST